MQDTIQVTSNLHFIFLNENFDELGIDWIKNGNNVKPRICKSDYLFFFENDLLRNELIIDFLPKENWSVYRNKFFYIKEVRK